MPERMDLKELCSFFRENREKKFMLTFHSMGDRDAIGSALAMCTYLKDAVVATPDFITHNAKQMLDKTQYKDYVKHEFREDADFAVVFDANNLTVLGSFGEKLSSFKGRIVFVDHHLPPEALPANATMFNDESFCATCDIVYEVLKQLGAGLDNDIQLMLLSGIISDSAEFQNSTPKTFVHIAELLEKSGLSYSDVMANFHESVSSQARFATINDIFDSNIEQVGKYVIIYGRTSTHANVAADLALKLGADFGLFWMANEKEATISARLRPPLDAKLRIHLGTMMKGISTLLNGTGGGHPCAAGAYGPNRELLPDAVNKCLGDIKRIFQGNGK